MAIGEVADEKGDHHQVVFADGEACDAPINPRAAILSLVIRQDGYSQLNIWPAIVGLNPLGGFLLSNLQVVTFNGRHPGDVKQPKC